MCIEGPTPPRYNILRHHPGNKAIHIIICVWRLLGNHSVWWLFVLKESYPSCRIHVHREKNYVLDGKVSLGKENFILTLFQPVPR